MNRIAQDPGAGGGFLPLPMVHVREEPAWEYRQLVRNLAKEDAPSEGELNALGGDGWELTAVFTDSPFVYFYFKRWKG
ncbi:MAG TPA: hypothetical protein VGR27_05750 [Longimicrobiaceae bacterium]|nr:hypothetical protein [Longimicrobiaceae bacterium]